MRRDRGVTVEAGGAVSSELLTFREAKATLAGLQKSAHGAPAYSRWVNRRVGRELAAAAYVAGLTPNAVTALSTLATMGAVVSLALVPPSVPVGLLQALALAIGYALDSADGQLARLQGSGSPAGEWLDHVVDAVKTATLHLAVAVGWFRFGEQGSVWLMVPLVMSAAVTVLFFAMTLTDQLRRTSAGRTEAFRAGERASAPVLYSLAVLPVDYGVVCWVFALGGWPVVFRWAYLVLVAAQVGFLLLALPKWYLEMRRLSAR